MNLFKQYSELSTSIYRTGFVPKDYQERFLKDRSRIKAGIWPRNSGKTASIIESALDNICFRDKRVLIVSPNEAMRRNLQGTIQYRRRQINGCLTGDLDTVGSFSLDGMDLSVYDIIYVDEYFHINNDTLLRILNDSSPSAKLYFLGSPFYIHDSINGAIERIHNEGSIYRVSGEDIFTTRQIDELRRIMSNEQYRHDILAQF